MRGVLRPIIWWCLVARTRRGASGGAGGVGVGDAAGARQVFPRLLGRQLLQIRGGQDVFIVGEGRDEDDPVRPLFTSSSCS